jgi:pyruvate kinase
LISRYRPQVPIVALTPEVETLRRMALIWGVLPLETRDQQRIDTLAEVTEKKLLKERLVKKGDVIGIVAGTPMGVRGTTNFMKFHVIGSDR